MPRFTTSNSAVQSFYNAILLMNTLTMLILQTHSQIGTIFGDNY